MIMSRLDAVVNWTERARLTNYQSGELARLCSVSRSQLRRHFLDLFRRTPQAWLDELRLWDALQLLCTMPFSVKEVAYKLQFASASHFCHRFKQYHGCTARHLVLNYSTFLNQWLICRDCPRAPRCSARIVPVWKIGERALCRGKRLKLGTIIRRPPSCPAGGDR
jgi:AraC-like DNA-binding protein